MIGSLCFHLFSTADLSSFVIVGAEVACVSLCVVRRGDGVFIFESGTTPLFLLSASVGATSSVDASTTLGACLTSLVIYLSLCCCSTTEKSDSGRCACFVCSFASLLSFSIAENSESNSGFCVN